MAIMETPVFLLISSSAMVYINKVLSFDEPLPIPSPPVEGSFPSFQWK
jgi:hypothetical protein